MTSPTSAIFARALRSAGAGLPTLAMVVLATSEQGGFEVDDSFERLDLKKLHAILSSMYWNAGASMEKVEACARGSKVFGLYGGPSKAALAGFMRLVTDERSFYYVSDVFIDDSLQGKGLGEFLIRTALSQRGIADSGRGFLFTGDPRSPPWYTSIAGFQIINEQPAVFPNGKAGTRWCMLRAPGPLLPKGEVVPDPAPGGSAGLSLGPGAACALAGVAAAIGFIVGRARM